MLQPRLSWLWHCGRTSIGLDCSHSQAEMARMCAFAWQVTPELRKCFRQYRQAQSSVANRKSKETSEDPQPGRGAKIPSGVQWPRDFTGCFVFPSACAIKCGDTLHEAEISFVKHVCPPPIIPTASVSVDLQRSITPVCFQDPQGAYCLAHCGKGEPPRDIIGNAKWPVFECDLS